MSATLYDKALVKRLKEVTGDERIRIISPEESISFFAQFDKDKVKYPAIVLSRGTITLSDYKNQVAALKGQTVRINEDNTATKIRLLNMTMEWNLDVYAVDRFSCDEIVRELVVYFTTNPRFDVEVPYGADISQNFDVFLRPEIVDNSDLIEFPNTGEYFRETLSLYTENAHMFSTRRQYLTKVSADVKDDLK